MPRHDRTPRRRPPVRQERLRVLVYCGGVRTEPAYFDGLKGTRELPIALEVKSKGVAPDRLIALAVAYAQRNPGYYDSVWCVVDVDQFDVAAAAARATASKVQLAVSNPCFELWLLLHLCDRRSAARDCTEIARHLRQQLPGYDKTRLDFSDFRAGLTKAIHRAKALDDDTPYPNPSTGVWRLVDHIIDPSGEAL